MTRVSLKMSMEVWNNSAQSGPQLLLLLALADYADDDGKCFPSVRALSVKTRVTPRAVQHLLRQLKDSGELAIQYGAGPRGANVFVVKPTSGVKPVAGVQQPSGVKPITGEADFTEGVQPVSPGGEAERTEGVKPISPKQSLTVIQRSKNGQSPRAGARANDPTFTEFAEMFKTRRNVGYGHTRADFVQLANLRKRLGVETGAPIPDWARAVTNYLSTGLSKYSLADLATRFDVFLHSALDRYGKPTERNTGDPLRRTIFGRPQPFRYKPKQ